MAEELEKLGAKTTEEPDTLTVHGSESDLRGASVDGRADHRIVMALARGRARRRGHHDDPRRRARRRLLPELLRCDGRPRDSRPSSRATAGASRARRRFIRAVRWRRRRLFAAGCKRELRSRPACLFAPIGREAPATKPGEPRRGGVRLCGCGAGWDSKGQSRGRSTLQQAPQRATRARRSAAKARESSRLGLWRCPLASHRSRSTERLGLWRSSPWSRRLL